MTICTGPKIFLARLNKSELDFNGFKILNPDPSINNNINKNIIARLDGVNCLGDNINNLQNYLKSRKFFILSYLIKIFFLPFLKKLITKFLNKKLNRHTIWLINNSQGFIFQSDLSFKMHKKFLNFKKKNYCIINNGVDLKEFNPIYKKKYSNTKSIIISCSFYRPHKRLHEAVKLINFLNSNYIKCKLHILGELDLLSKQTLKNIDLSNCIFHGIVGYKKLPKYYSHCDIQIHPAIFDPCPNVVVEGLASGLPVITVVQSGAYELINKNKDWCVDEKIKLKPINFYNYKFIPEIPLNKYAEKIVKIFDNLNYHKKKARYIAEKNLNIDKIAKSYLEYANSIKKKY